MIRLTVVTIAGLIGTTVTGFFGMNLLAWADAPLLDRAVFFFAVLVPIVALTIFTVTGRDAWPSSWTSCQTSA